MLQKKAKLNITDGHNQVEAWAEALAEKAIVIEIPRDRLEAYSLTITQIAQMLGAQNLQSSGGQITQGDINYTISTSGKYSSLDDIRILAALNIHGAIIGKAYYIGAINLKEALEAAEND